MNNWEKSKTKLRARACPKCSGTKNGTITIATLNFNTGLCIKGLNCKMAFIEEVLTEHKSVCEDVDGLERDYDSSLKEIERLRERIRVMELMQQQRQVEHERQIQQLLQLQQQQQERQQQQNQQYPVQPNTVNNFYITNIISLNNKGIPALRHFGGNVVALCSTICEYFQKNGNEQEKALAQQWYTRDEKTQKTCANRILELIDQENETTKPNDYDKVKSIIEYNKQQCKI